MSSSSASPSSAESLDITSTSALTIHGPSTVADAGYHMGVVPEVVHDTPAATPVKFYQVGSFAVGNRLLPVSERSVQSDPKRFNSLTSGHRACQGCGEALGARYALDAAMRAS